MFFPLHSLLTCGLSTPAFLTTSCVCLCPRVPISQLFPEVSVVWNTLSPALNTATSSYPFGSLLQCGLQETPSVNTATYRSFCELDNLCCNGLSLPLLPARALSYLKGMSMAECQANFICKVGSRLDLAGDLSIAALF